MNRSSDEFRTVIFTAAMHGGFELTLCTFSIFKADVRTDLYFLQSVYVLVNVLLSIH